MVCFINFPDGRGTKLSESLCFTGRQFISAARWENVRHSLLKNGGGGETVQLIYEMLIITFLC